MATTVAATGSIDKTGPRRRRDTPQSSSEQRPSS